MDGHLLAFRGEVVHILGAVNFCLHALGDLVHEHQDIIAECKKFKVHLHSLILLRNLWQKLGEIQMDIGLYFYDDVFLNFPIQPFDGLGQNPNLLVTNHRKFGDASLKYPPRTSPNHAEYCRQFCHRSDWHSRGWCIWMAYTRHLLCSTIQKESAKL